MNWLQDFAAIAVVLALTTGALTIILNDRRWMLLALAGMYVALTWMAAIAIPLEIAIVKLVAGMMVCAILALSVVHAGPEAQGLIGGGLPSGMVFRVIAVLLVVATAWGLSERGWVSLPQSMNRAAILGSMVLLSLGLLHLGVSEDPFRVGLGLITALAGFEILYAAIEPSLAMLALLAAVHIGISIIVSYLVVEVSTRRVGETR
jgi:hypothetical protein